MKLRNIALIAACSLLAASSAGCGGSSSSSSPESKTSAASTEAETVSTEESTEASSAEVTTSKIPQTAGSGSAPEEALGGDIEGVWVSYDLYDGVPASAEFSPDGTGSLAIDASEYISFGADGKVNMMGSEDSKYDYDGKTLSISISSDDSDTDGDTDNSFTFSMVLLSLERTGEPDTSSIDGEYIIKDGVMKDYIVTELDSYLGGNSDNVPLTADISGSSVMLRVSDAFTYSTDGNSLSVEVIDELKDTFDKLGGSELYYTADDSKLTLYSSSGSVTLDRKEK